MLAYIEPRNTVAQRIKDRCVRKGKLETSAFPEATSVPRRVLDWSSLEGRELSRKAVYLLSLVDGQSTVESIVDSSAISPLDAYDVLDFLLREGIVAIEGRCDDCA